MSGEVTLLLLRTKVSQMRATTILFLLLICFQNAFSQKEDYFWMFGYASDTSTMEYGGTNIDFNQEPPVISYEFREMNFFIANASICDSLGDLLFYTNGIYISNSIGETMENGDGLNPDPYTDDWIDIGYPLYQGALVLPLPENPHRYYLFHEEYSWTPNDPVHIAKIFTLYYSLIDMSANDGLGKVIEKNVPVLQDTLDFGKITASKHANGKDWWLLIPEFDSNRYYRILFTEEGVSSVESQSVGEFVYAGLGQAVFSPDGNKYVRYILKNINDGNYLNIYDFDRCTGLLSNHIQFNIIDTAYAGGVAISPNSRYLYVPSFGYTYQYDLQVDDIQSSKDTVAIYDGFLGPYFPTTFFLAQLAPDGKIYINSNNGVNNLHVIHQPNEPGEECDFEQHGIQLPTFNAASLPNFPNYSLGSSLDSCETVSISTLTDNKTRIKIYPTLARTVVNIEFEKPEIDTDWRLYNEFGQVVLNQSFRNSFSIQKIDISSLPPGIYFWQAYSIKHGHLGEGKMVKVKD